MEKKLQKIGNSYGIILDKTLLRLLKLNTEESDVYFEMEITEKGLLLVPTKKKKKE